MTDTIVQNGFDSGIKSTVEINDDISSENGSVSGDSGYMTIVTDIDSGNGIQLYGEGQPSVDLIVDHNPVVAVFRGQQIESDDINIETNYNISLTGVSIGGSISDIQVPVEILYASMDVGKTFVLGQIPEIPKISLDSSIKLGVKLYSYDNKLLNPSTFSSAYFTFDDTLLMQANIDPVSSLLYVLATPTDLSVFVRNKIYDMRVHTVDKSGYPSIVLTQKVRFI